MHDIIFKLQFAKCLFDENCYHLLSSSQCRSVFMQIATALIELNVAGQSSCWQNSPNVLLLCYHYYHCFGLKWHIPKTGILISQKNGLPFSGHSTKCNQIVNSPQNGVSYFENKWFDVFRGCNKIHVFLNIYGCMECWHAICSQKIHENSVAEFGENVIIVLSSSRPLFHAYQMSTPHVV
jgi:hypothetical protein